MNFYRRALERILPVGTLADPVALGAKALLSCLLALLLNRLIGNPDTVSATFVSVVCISPTVLMGLRQALQQFAASLLGAAWGTLFAYLGVDVIYGVPAAVAGAVLFSFVLRIGSGYVVAAFTALFVQLVTRGTALETAFIHLGAVLVGAFSALLINTAASSLFYREIFGRRYELGRNAVFDLWPRAVLRPLEVQHGFEMLARLKIEIRTGMTELQRRGSAAELRLLRRLFRDTGRLMQLLHLAVDIGEILNERKVPDPTRQAYIAWLSDPEGEAPLRFEELRHPAERLLYEKGRLSS